MNPHHNSTQPLGQIIAPHTASEAQLAQQRAQSASKKDQLLALQQQMQQQRTGQDGLMLNATHP